MSALSIIINIVLILLSIGLIIAVLMQEGQRQGLGAIGGGAETFFGKNKADSVEGKLKRYTKILAAVFIVLAIVATIVNGHVTSSTATAADVAEAVEDATEETAEAVEETAEEAAEAVEDAADEAADAVEEAAGEAAEETVEAAEETVEAAEEAVEEAADEAAGK